MKKVVIRYILAAIFVFWIGEQMICHNSFPEWSWLYIELTGIMWLWAFGIAEKVYKKKVLTFKACPMTMLGIYITLISGVLAIIQLILIIHQY